MATTYDRVKNIFQTNFDLSEESLYPEATIESIGLDSLDRIECLFVLEKEFKVKIPDRQITLTCAWDMQGIAEVIDRLMAEQHSTQMATA